MHKYSYNYLKEDKFCSLKNQLKYLMLIKKKLSALTYKANT